MTTISIGCLGQSIDKVYSGSWARTTWTLEFNKDNTYRRTSNGHFGYTVYVGNYEMTADTIVLVTGNEQILGIKNEKYLIDRDSILIDLQLFYDYKILDNITEIYNSQKRYDILRKPNMDSLIVVSIQQFDSIVKHCTRLLKTHSCYELKDADHIKIIRVINTINMSQEITCQNGIYGEFIKLVKYKDYEKEITTLYDWLPNRGMGFYFEKLQVELGGTPHLYSRFTIK